MKERKKGKERKEGRKGKDGKKENQRKKRRKTKDGKKENKGRKERKTKEGKKELRKERTLDLTITWTDSSLTSCFPATRTWLALRPAATATPPSAQATRPKVCKIARK